MASDIQFPIIDTCSYVLISYISTLPTFKKSNPQSAFNSKNVPRISISDYVARFKKYLGCSETCYIFALLYLDRLSKNASCSISKSNIHRLYLTAIVLAIKFHDDVVTM